MSYLNVAHLYDLQVRRIVNSNIAIGDDGGNKGSNKGHAQQFGLLAELADSFVVYRPLGQLKPTQLQRVFAVDAHRNSRNL